MYGRIIKKEGKLYFDEGKILVRLVEQMSGKMAQYAGKEVIFGIRPEDIYDKLFTTSAIPENIINATCEVIEPMGSEVYLYLNTGRHIFVARVGAHDRPPINKDMDLVFDMSKVHFFEKDTEVTIL